MERRFKVDGIELAGHLARPVETHPNAQPGLVIAHGFPAEVGGGINSTASFPELADRIATELGWVALAYSSRGVGESGGDFSLNGWLRDLNGAVTHLRQSAPVDAVYLLGFGTGGALAIEAAAANPKIQGVAAVGTPADFTDWARYPRKLLVLANEMNLIRDRSFPASFDTWAEGLGRCALPMLHRGWRPGNSWSCMAATTNRCRSSTPGGRRWSRSRRPAHRAGGRTPPPPRPTGDCDPARMARAAALGAGPQHLARIPVAQVVLGSLVLGFAGCLLRLLPGAHGESFLGAAHVGNRARLVVAERG